MEKDYIVLQVRLRSQRLPEKLLLPLKGITIFEHILKRLSGARLPEGIIVATTEDTEPRIKDIMEGYDASIYTGSEDDVLSRFAGAVDYFNAGNVIRATGDNPLVSIEYIDRALILHKEQDADLTTYPSLPYGTGIEVIRGAVINQIDCLAADQYEREHITQYIYRNEHLYKIVRGTPEPSLLRPEIRLTVDTDEDYRVMTDIYENLYTGLPIKLTEAISYLDQRRMKQEC